MPTYAPLLSPTAVLENLIAKYPGVQDEIDDMVTDEFMELASGVNNGGFVDQLEFLLANRTLDEVLAGLDLPPGVNPLTGEAA
jgi:hypothetical protein